MQALFRAQASVRSQRALRLLNISNRFTPDNRARRSMVRIASHFPYFIKTFFFTKKCSECNATVVILMEWHNILNTAKTSICFRFSLILVRMASHFCNFFFETNSKWCYRSKKKNTWKCSECSATIVNLPEGRLTKHPEHMGLFSILIHFNFLAFSGKIRWNEERIPQQEAICRKRDTCLRGKSENRWGWHLQAKIKIKANLGFRRRPILPICHIFFPMPHSHSYIRSRLQKPSPLRMELHWRRVKMLHCPKYPSFWQLY